MDDKMFSSIFKKIQGTDWWGRGVHLHPLNPPGSATDGIKGNENCGVTLEMSSKPCIFFWSK